MKAIVREIQVGGFHTCHSLEDMCEEYLDMIRHPAHRSKVIFVIELPNKEVKQITIRDEDTETVAYGNFEGLPDMLDYAKEVLGGSDL